MREAAETLWDIGLEPLTALATTERQDWLVKEMAQRQISVRPGEPFSWQQLADAIGKESSLETEAPARGLTSGDGHIGRTKARSYFRKK
jgi:hypothetical protein